MLKKCKASRQQIIDVDVACPGCGLDLVETGELTVYEYVLAKNDPEGKARLDLLFHCQHCEQEWNAFVPLENFFRNPVEVAHVKRA
jgi:hypothetical protein